MNIRDLNGKTVLVLGYGKEGRATVKALETFAPDAEITIADTNAAIAEKDAKHWWQLGEGWLENLGKFDVIVKSPGIPMHDELRMQAGKITGAVQIFLDSIADTGAVVVGVTGSKGKSTTSSLLHAMLRQAGKRSLLVGNIGEPSIAHIADAKKGTVFVHELSSYMLQGMTTSPHVAVVTSFFPEHLDYHGSVNAYLGAKANIARFQREDDAVFFNADAPGAVSIASEGHGRKFPVHADECPVDLERTKLIGDHNRENLALAWRAAEFLGVGKDDAVAAATGFAPLPHRLQPLGEIAGLRWVDDAISTTPESAVAALDALGDDVRTIILGGRDRGNDFAPLAERLRDSSVTTVLLFPGSGPRIRAAIESAGGRAALVDVASMEDAVRTARENTPAGGIVLLSTASPSYGMFANFEEKGDAFRACIEALGD